MTNYDPPAMSPSAGRSSASSLQLPDPATVAAAEHDCLMTCALRCDGYALADAIGYDFLADQDALIERGTLPDEPDARLVQFFMLQRALDKYGLEGARRWSKYWRAYRHLFLSVYALDVPEARRLKGLERPYYRWRDRYAPQREAWADLVRRIDAATEYSPFDGFDFEPWRPAVDAYDTVWRALQDERGAAGGLR